MAGADLAFTHVKKQESNRTTLLDLLGVAPASGTRATQQRVRIELNATRKGARESMNLFFSARKKTRTL
jgi:hypothetical protein